jgi:ATP-dependent helicase/nuclease subunit B
VRLEHGEAGTEQRNALALIADLEAAFAPLIALSADGASRGAAELAEAHAAVAEALARDASGESSHLWSGDAGEALTVLLAELIAAVSSLHITASDYPSFYRSLVANQAVRPRASAHPRLFIWGPLEARLQQPDLVILGSLNEGVWPALPAPDAWLPPKVRARLNMPTLDNRIGLAAHDFASALGAPEVLITRARRDVKSPTVASRFLLRLEAISGGLQRDVRLERLVRAFDDPGPPQPVGRPAPSPPAEQRPDAISVTAVDRLKADPFAFYAQAILKLRKKDPVDDDHTARWKGIAVHAVLQEWLQQDECNPDKLRPRAERLPALA